MIRYFTAGESHGKRVSVIMEGVPAGLKISADYINKQLARRQRGYGRGKRMQIESDCVEINSGIRWGETIGSPICLSIENRDWENCKKIMSVSGKDRAEDLILSRPRPGHADLAGILKYDRKDMRDILERASARETAARVASGAVARKFLQELGIRIMSYTRQIGNVSFDDSRITIEDLIKISEDSPLSCPDKKIEEKMMREIDNTGKAGDTVGGVFCVVAAGVPAGLGSHTQWDLKIDGRIAQALMSIQAVKGVESGGGFSSAAKKGSEVHDEISYDKKRKVYYRNTNNAGGIEGGMTNGEPLVFSAAMKPISSLAKPLMSVNIKTKKKEASEIVRSDVCAVPAAGVIGEAVVAIEIAKALLEKTGGDSMREVKRNYKGYLSQIKNC